jgi:FADH2 O2-dependent halogenase
MTLDVLIIGSSFSGSMLAWILASQGMRVSIIDRGHHPRFAIGESSTPAADMVIADLAARYQLPGLAPLSRYGSWKAQLPLLGCGKKRGFSYFRHRSGKAYADSPAHESSLLVAASSGDAQSDTHWLRSDVDAYLFQQAGAAGALTREGCDLESLERTRDGWQVRWRQGSAPTEQVRCSVVIDASGAAGVLGTHLGLHRNHTSLETHTSAIFSHFRGVGSWDALRLAAGDTSTIEPFRSDAAAQHHLLDHGWVWILRFDDGLTSVGLVEPGTPPASTVDRGQIWSETLSRYPSLWSLMATAEAVRPITGMGPMQRLWSQASGPGWAMLPTTAGFVDPLHSTGIAHAVHGVARLADLLLSDRHVTDDWLTYGNAVCDEIRWIDQLVSAAYVTMGEQQLFQAACVLFFLATIRFEQTAKAGTPPHASGFLAADAASLRRDLVAGRDAILRAAAGASAVADTLESLRESLQCYDTAGLFNRAAANRFAHTAPR